MKIVIGTETFRATGNIPNMTGGNAFVEFKEAGTFDLAEFQFTGIVDFKEKDGTLLLRSRSSIFGHVDSEGGPAGTINIQGNSEILGSIGAKNPLKAINVNKGVLTVGSDIASIDITVNDGALKAKSDIKSNTISISNKGHLNAEGGIAGICGGNTAVTINKGALNLEKDSALRGSVLFDGNFGHLSLSSGSSVSEFVDCTVGSSSRIWVFGNSTVNGAIGATNEIHEIATFEEAILSSNSAIKSRDLILSDGSQIISSSLNITSRLAAGANSKITGDLNLNGAALDLGSNIIKVGGKVVATGEITINAIVNGADTGCMHATGVDLSASTLVINIDQASVVKAGTVRLLDKVTADTEVEVVISYTGASTGYTFSYAMGKLTINKTSDSTTSVEAGSAIDSDPVDFSVEPTHPAVGVSPSCCVVS